MKSFYVKATLPFQKKLLPNLYSRKTGHLRLSPRTLPSTERILGWEYYEDGLAEEPVLLRIFERATFRLELIHAILPHDDEFEFSDLPSGYSLLFAMEGSIRLQAGSSAVKWIHERGSHLVFSPNGGFSIGLKKKQSSLFAVLYIAGSLVEEWLQAAGKNWPQHPGKACFFHSQAAIGGRACREKLSLLFFEQTDTGSATGSPEELVRWLLQWILSQAPSLSFQPASPGFDEAQWFYQEKKKLLGQINKALPFSDLIRSSGLQDLALFRKRTRQIYGMNIEDLIAEARFCDASNLLRKNEFSIKQIAGLTGFRTVNYFTRAFGKYFGEPPGKFKLRNIQ
jgi:AraC-like DNA-binding protein